MAATTKIGRVSAVFLLIAGIILAPAVVAAQGSDSPVLVDWRDYAGAQAHVDGLIERLAEIKEELGGVEAELAELGTQLSVLSLDEGLATERLAAAQKQARELAVQAYVTGSTAELDSFLLGAGDAAEMTYMRFLLEEYAETTLEAGRNFMELREQAGAGAIELSNQIDAVRAREGELAAEAAKLTAALPEAEHRLYIASIHATADNSFGRSGRPDPTPQQWESLRFCESTLDYAKSTGNGFYGAYQFTIDTWYTVGGSSSPNVASPEEQDARARLLYARRGSQPWPICGRYLP